MAVKKEIEFIQEKYSNYIHQTADNASTLAT